MNDFTGLPNEVIGVVSLLHDAGFMRAAERGGGHVNRVIELRSEAFGLRLIADRGEWWIEGGVTQQEEWFDADVWRACLEGGPATFDPSPFMEQARYFLAHSDDLATAAMVPGTTRCLARTRTRRARERLGLPPAIEGEEQ